MITSSGNGKKTKTDQKRFTGGKIKEKNKWGTKNPSRQDTPKYFRDEHDETAIMNTRKWNKRLKDLKNN